MRHKVFLAFPGSDGKYGAFHGLATASRNHDVTVQNYEDGDNFQVLWSWALAQAERGRHTHFAMLHADVCPQEGWLDVILGEMDWYRAAMISAHIAIKDNRGLTSTGILDPANPWRPLRRFTIREMMAKPPGSYTAESFGYGKPYALNHNNGCFAADLRRAEWYETDGDELRIQFAMPRRIIKNAKGYLAQCESEDWYFSRKVAEAGLPTRVTNRVRIVHREGKIEFPNDVPGRYEVDEDNKDLWEQVEMVA